MKKILKLTLLVTALTNLLTAEVVFDLGAQQLYYCVTDKTNSDGTKSDQYIEASYDVGDAIVSTGLISENGYYRPAPRSSGYFGVKIKEPKSSSAITFSMYCSMRENEGCSVQLLDDSGKALNMDFNKDAISIAGVTQTDDTFSGSYINEYGSSINGSVEINSNGMEIIINGSHKFVIDKSNFNLAKVNVSLFTTGSTELGYTDKLNSLVISNN